MSPHERTLIIIKPDAIQRGLLGEIIKRFEQKGLLIVGLKMIHLSDLTIEKHYEHHKDKPFFASLKKYMQSSPVVVMVLEGYEAVNAARLLAGPTKGYTADAGSIRGDFSISGQSNIVHASDSRENATVEIQRFFTDNELFAYRRSDYEILYAEDEKSR